MCALITSQRAPAQTPRASQRQIPRFEDYPVPEKWQGPAAPVKLTTASERMFATRLREASKQPPDFAGHYRFAGWGCGSACAAGAIIDLATGNVYQPPFAGKAGGWVLPKVPQDYRGSRYAHAAKSWSRRTAKFPIKCDRKAAIAVSQYDGRLKIEPTANDTSVPGGGVKFRRAK